MKEKIEQLKQFDTPSITNVVATYPNREICLGLYNPWETNWYTDQSLKCMYPELGSVAGHVITCVFGIADPNYNRLGIKDILKAIDASPQPVVLAIKNNFPDEIKDKAALIGGNLMTAFKSVGCVGVIADGPSRDVDEIREMGVQYMITGVTPGHGDFGIQAVNVPVSICGMDLAPGEIVHMDENGACKFPADHIDEVISRTKELQELEAYRMGKMAKAKDPDEIINILSGLYD